MPSPHKTPSFMLADAGPCPGPEIDSIRYLHTNALDFRFCQVSKPTCRCKPQLTVEICVLYTYIRYGSRTKRTLVPITQWPHPRIWEWARAEQPSIATCSQFGFEQATSLRGLHEYKSGATCLQHAYAALAESFAQCNLEHGRGHSIMSSGAGPMTGNAHLLAFSSRQAIPDSFSMDNYSCSPRLAKLAFHTRWIAVTMTREWNSLAVPHPYPTTSSPYT